MTSFNTGKTLCFKNHGIYYANCSIWDILWVISLWKQSSRLARRILWLWQQCAKRLCCISRRRGVSRVVLQLPMDNLQEHYCCTRESRCFLQVVLLYINPRIGCVQLNYGKASEVSAFDPFRSVRVYTPPGCSQITICKDHPGYCNRHINLKRVNPMLTQPMMEDSDKKHRGVLSFQFGRSLGVFAQFHLLHIWFDIDWLYRCLPSCWFNSLFKIFSTF